MVKTKEKAHILVVSLTIILVFIASVSLAFATPSKAYAMDSSIPITTPDGLITALDNLYNDREDWSAYHDYSVDAEITLTADFFPKNYNGMLNGSAITFYYPVKNVQNYCDGDLTSNLHYGLIKCDDYGGDFLHVYYGVTLNAGEGATINANNLTRYEYSVGATLPTASDITAPNGKTFSKWIVTGDSSETAVTSISASDWGVKNYTAVWSSSTPEQGENSGEGEDPIPEPQTAEIKYYNLLGADDSTLPTLYTEGEALVIPSITKAGYSFIGFCIKDTSTNVESLPESLDDGVIAEDGFIHLSAVWELDAPSIEYLSTITKDYNGVSEVLNPTHTHNSSEPLSYSYSWRYSVDDTVYAEVATTEAISVKNVSESGYYRLTLTATDAYGNSASINSVPACVTINPIALTIAKGTATPNITKPYDGLVDCDFNFIYGTHYLLRGAIEGEIASVSYVSNYDAVNANDNRKVIVTFGALVMNTGFDVSNYSYLPNSVSLTYSAQITIRDITLVTSSTPSITKTYDATVDCNHSFEYGVDYKILGAVEGEITGVNYVAVYDSVNASELRTVVFTATGIIMAEGKSASNYSALTEIYYQASITPKAITITPDTMSKTYGEVDNLIRDLPVGVKSEIVTVTFERVNGETVNSYEYTAVTTSNSNYDVSLVSPCPNKFNITPATPIVLFPRFIARDYDPSTALKDLVPSQSDFEGFVDYYEISAGRYFWVDANLTPSAKTNKYQMYFDPNDTHNYDYSNIDGWDQDDGLVYRDITINVNKINPVYPELPTTDGLFIIPIGATLEYVNLPSGWGYAEDSQLSKDTIVNIPSGSTANYANALVFTPDDTDNYNLIYEDLILKALAPTVYYVFNGEKRNLGNLITVNSSPEGEQTVSTNLKNPFTKIGYHVYSWTINEVVTITVDEGYDVGGTYTFTDLSLIDFNVNVEVAFAPNTNTKVTIKHFYESVSGGYASGADVIDSSRYGTSDTTYALVDEDRKNKNGFIYQYATLEGSQDEVTSATISADGSTTFCLYYKRKTIDITYVDTNYTNLGPIGSLPIGKTVMFGAPFYLDKPSNYVIYGYSFKGYTDAVTYEGNSLKVFGVAPYVITDPSIDNLTFTIVMEPNVSTEYVVRRYFDGVEDAVVLYGVTGTTVNIANMNLLGYVRAPREDEVLTGVISGYVKDLDGNITAGARLELKIYFESKLYDLSFSGTEGTPTQQAKVGETVTLPDTPTAPEGYAFSGWLINGAMYSAGSSYVMPASQVTVTAVWSKLSVPEDTPETPSIDTDNGSSEDDKAEPALDGGAIAGIAIGAVAGIALITMVSLIVGRRSSKRAKIAAKIALNHKNKSK